MRSAVGPVPEIDTTVASQSSDTKVLASGGSFQDVCGELIEVVQDRPVQNPKLISNLLWGAFRYPTYTDFRISDTRLYGVCPCLIVGSEHIARSHATSSNKPLTLFSAMVVFRILFLVCVDFNRYPRNENCR